MPALQPGSGPVTVGINPLFLGGAVWLWRGGGAPGRSPVAPLCHGLALACIRRLLVSSGREQGEKTAFAPGTKYFPVGHRAVAGAKENFAPGHPLALVKVWARSGAKLSFAPRSSPEQVSLLLELVSMRRQPVGPNGPQGAKIIRAPGAAVPLAGSLKQPFGQRQLAIVLERVQVRSSPRPFRAPGNTVRLDRCHPTDDPVSTSAFHATVNKGSEATVPRRITRMGGPPFDEQSCILCNGTSDMVNA